MPVDLEKEMEKYTSQTISKILLDEAIDYSKDQHNDSSDDENVIKDKADSEESDDSDVSFDNDPDDVGRDDGVSIPSKSENKKAHAKLDHQKKAEDEVQLRVDEKNGSGEEKEAAKQATPQVTPDIRMESRRSGLKDLVRKSF